jgi:hypothetical protein
VNPLAECCGGPHGHTSCPFLLTTTTLPLCPVPGPAPVSCKPPLDHAPHFDLEDAIYKIYEASDLAARESAECTGCPDCMADESYHRVHQAMDAHVYAPEFGLAYDPMVCPLAYYACVKCHALFSYPVDANPICGECEYDGFNAALLVQAMDEEVQTDDLPARHALPVEPAWKPVTLTARGSDFISASPLSTASAQSYGSTRTGEGWGERQTSTAPMATLASRPPGSMRPGAPSATMSTGGLAPAQTATPLHLVTLLLIADNVPPGLLHKARMRGICR